MEPLKALEGIGVQKVGSWALVSGAPAFTLESDEPAKSVLYAFVSGGQVLYLGKTTESLRRRMRGYQQPGRTQCTNIAVRAKILELLGAQRQLDIYALFDRGALRHGSFEINLAAGLEDSLLRELRPDWNTVGK